MLSEDEESSSPVVHLPHSEEDAINPYHPATNDSIPPPREHALTERLLHLNPNDGTENLGTIRRRSASGKRKPQSATLGEDSSTIQMHNDAESKKANGDPSAPKPGLGPRPIGGDEKLGLFSGVYVPTCLNVLSILMFLRFGFILGLYHHLPSRTRLLTYL
jgi:potassium/chloride transporter 9